MIDDRSFDTSGMPWIQDFTEGVVELDQCAACGVSRRYTRGDMCASLMERKGTQWPDLIGTGYMVGLFVASKSFLQALLSSGVRVEVGGRVAINPRVPKRLSLEDAPEYYWVDGEKHLAAKMDYEASGFVGTEYCAACGARSFDIAASKVTSYVFEYDATSGLDLFTTDMNPRVFFCTERVLECCREHRPKNVAIRPLEEGPFAKSVKFW